MVFSDIIEEESGCSFRCDHCVCRNEVYSFGDRVHDSHDGIMSGGLQEFDHKIDAECIPLCVRHRERLQLTNQRILLGFVWRQRSQILTYWLMYLDI